MKKNTSIIVVVAVVIIASIIIEIKMKNLYFDNSNNTDPEKIAEISTIVFQSILSGTITFLGLLFTIVTQGFQNESKEKKQLCPCFIIITKGKVSAEIDKIEIKDEAINVEKNEKSFRIQDCILINVKNNYALNTYFLGTNNKKQYFENNAEHATILSLALSARGAGNFFVFFEDVYGNKYKQKIKYFLNDTENEYQFVSKAPKGVNKK